MDGGEDVDGDAEERGGRRDDAEAAADDEKRVGAGARLASRNAAADGLRRRVGPRPRRTPVLHGSGATLQGSRRFAVQPSSPTRRGELEERGGMPGAFKAGEDGSRGPGARGGGPMA